MNDILQLKGRFENDKNPSKPGAPKLPKGQKLQAKHVSKLSKQLESIYKFWESDTVIGGALVSVHYKHIVAKSNRVKALFVEKGATSSDSIRGAKFVWGTNAGGQRIQKHVFTHYVSLEALKKSIDILKSTADLIEEFYNGVINYDDMVGQIIIPKSKFKYISKSKFLAAVVDAFYVESFNIDSPDKKFNDTSIITIYKTKIDTKELLAHYNINVFDDRIINETTIRLNKNELAILYDNAPFLISMGITDFSKMTKDDFSFKVEESEGITIPSPTNEPIVGVIDTHFDEKVYFHEWVDYKNMLDDSIELEKKDFAHGTAVSYIIVDGPSGNERLQDGCGRFRVKHFGVAKANGFSSFAVLKMIRNIVSSNRDIKVWNLSLGSVLEVNDNFISPEAAELDRIQCEYDVIFVVAGTNKPKFESKNEMRIGAPADSLNSLVVNSVDFSGSSASYTRSGPVLSFFNKPDISYYGGDGTNENKIVVCCDDLGASYVAGTSYAAPWITRKLAYLIHVMGLSREIAKALIIDSAAGWDRKDDMSHKIGYGIVPIHINSILRSEDDEIRFVMSGVSEEYETYNYNLPVPVVNECHPFYAKATLVYFPECNYNQGVDYTNTELDIHFGRIKADKNHSKIVSINDNQQAEDVKIVLYEEKARSVYRKWDNVKHIGDVIKGRKKTRKAYESGLWGLKVITKERFEKRDTPIRFGVIVTLKEMNGVNRIDTFIKLCQARNWLVTRLNLENQLDVYAKSEEEINFDI